MARPTDYTPEIIEKTRHYLENYASYDDELPTIEGLSLAINLARSTIYDWASQEDKQEFSDIVEDILSKQGKKLINKGLKGEYNASIAKLMLTKHGYRDAVDTDLTTKGKELTNLNPLDPKMVEISKRYAEEIKKNI